MESYLIRGLLQVHIDALNRAVSKEGAIATLLRYHDLCIFLVTYIDTEAEQTVYKVEADAAYQALSDAFIWLQNRFGFRVAIAKPPIPDSWEPPPPDPNDRN